MQVDDELLHRLFSLCNRGKVCSGAECDRNEEREAVEISHATIIDEFIEKFKV